MSGIGGPKRTSPARKVTAMLLCEARAEYVRWLAVVRDMSPHTIRAYEGDVVALERHLGAVTVDVLSRRHLVDFIGAQRAAGLASCSIRRRTAGVRSFCKWLMSAGLLEDDPCIGLTVELGRRRTLPRPVPGDDLSRLLVSLRNAARVGEEPIPDGALFRPHAATTLLAVGLMVTTGLRVAEVSNIRQGDIDLHDGSIRVVGKGARERRVFLTDSWLSNLVRAYFCTRVALGVGHETFFFNVHGRPLTPASIRSRLQRAGRDAGLVRRVTPHMLRHSAATQLIEAGVDIRYIQRLLGHASLTTTEIYTHVADHALKRIVSDADVLGRTFRRDN